MMISPYLMKYAKKADLYTGISDKNKLNSKL